MKRLFLLMAVGLLACGLAFLYGCDEDNAVTDTDDQDQFGPEDSSFIEELLTEDMLSVPLQSLGLSWELLDSIPGGPALKSKRPSLALEGDDEELIVVRAGYEGYHDGWHVFQCSVIAVEDYIFEEIHYYDTVFIGGIDSVQILSEGEPVQYPTELTVLDGLAEHIHVGWTDNSGEGTGDLNHLCGVDLDYVEGDTVLTINGLVDDEMYSGEENEWGNCEVTIGLYETVTNLRFNINQDTECPESGQISATGSIDAHCVGLQAGEADTLDVSGSWTVTAAINEGQGTVTVTFTNGIVSWTVTEPCEESAEASSGWIR